MADDDIIAEIGTGCILGVIGVTIGILFRLLLSRVGLFLLFLCIVIALVVALLPKIPPIEIPFGTIYIINTNGANGRDCPKQSCKSVATFKKGEEIKVLTTVQGDAIKDNSTWLLIWQKNSMVYVHSSLADLKKPSPSPTPDLTPNSSTYIVTDNNTRARRCPRLDCEVITKYHTGNEIQVSAREQGDAVNNDDVWLRVLYANPKIIYVHSSLAHPKEPDVPIPTPLSRCTPSDSHWNEQWDMVSIHLVEALQEFPACSPSPIDIGVIDSGVFRDHVELAGRIEKVETLAGGISSDISGHGTAVAGVIAAIPNNGVGMAGVHPTARLSIYKLGDYTPDDGNLIGDVTLIKTAHNVATLIKRAVDDGMMVINISSGFTNDVMQVKGKLIWCSPLIDNDCQGEMNEAVVYAEQHGVTVVAIAGNDGINTVQYPAIYANTTSNVISVAATTPSEDLAIYSNSGIVTIAAPGGNRATCKDVALDCILSLSNNGDYKEWAGTSFAAPHVTATIALMLSANPSLQPPAIRRIIQETARPYSSKPNREAGPGIVDAQKAVKAAKSLLPSH